MSERNFIQVTWVNFADGPSKRTTTVTATAPRPMLALPNSEDRVHWGLLQSAIGLPFGACRIGAQLMWAVMLYPLTVRYWPGWSIDQQVRAYRHPVSSLATGSNSVRLSAQFICDRFMNSRKIWAHDDLQIKVWQTPVSLTERPKADRTYDNRCNCNPLAKSRTNL